MGPIWHYTFIKKKSGFFYIKSMSLHIRYDMTLFLALALLR